MASLPAKIGGPGPRNRHLAGTGESAGKRMLAAVVSRKDRTWFYKLTGDAGLVESERGNFEKFVRSVKYP